MSLRRLFQRKAAAAPGRGPAPDLPAEPPAPSKAPLSAEQEEDLRSAWAQLTEAAERSKVVSFRACTRAGGSWTENPAAVRAIAVTLRDFPKDGAQPT
ncbi:hypothetical protein [Arthrobacter sp. NPDC056493]|uniref:hypothetical protein n=1 Tax=Arthrobacter sp. NPDC056493 TaxID=3345839 RepID=UPI003672CFF1